MPIYRVTQTRVLAGYDKCSYQYDAGTEIDSDHAPEGHVERLMASGALAPVEAGQSRLEEDDPRPARHRPARSGRDADAG